MEGEEKSYTDELKALADAINKAVEIVSTTNQSE